MRQTKLQKMIEEANRAIAELVYDKDDLQKAYNYYNGKRDLEQFRYLEENFGIGNPTSVQFTPLIRKHVDALVGEYLGSPIIPKVTCKDRDTISKISREKELAISKEVYTLLLNRLKNKLLDFIQTNDSTKLQDPYIAKDMETLIEDTSNNFVSKFEMAAQDVILYMLQSRATDMTTKLRMLLVDLLITGYTFYKVKPTPDGGNVLVEVLNPLNTFIDKNPNSPYVKDSFRGVVRRWMTKGQILNTYGKDLSLADRDSLEDMFGQDQFDYPGKYVRSFTDHCRETNGIMADTEIRVPGQPYNKASNFNYRLIPVYEVEWLETDKQFVTNRYEVIRIGEEIYIVKGLVKDVQRSISCPTYCGLSINGVYFDNRNDEPFSLVSACMHLQDKYDLLHFYRDNLIASSGTIGDWIDISMLPAQLGVTMPERLQKFLAYKKLGTALIDSSLEGRMATGQGLLNTIFNGYDDTVKALAVQAILFAIDSLELTVMSITGVFRERLNGIEARDAVTNVKIGQNNSFTVTKHWFLQMDLVVEEILIDSLNLAKRVFKKGLTGSLVLGEQYQRIFTALPEHFTVTDFDVHVIANSDIARDLEMLKQLAPQFIQSGMLLPDVLLDIMSTKSLSEAKWKVKSSMEKFKKENNAIQQLLLLLEQALQQMQQLLQLNQQLQTKVQQLDEKRLLLELTKIEKETEISWFEAKTLRLSVLNENANDTARTTAEIKLLNDGNPNNDRIVQMR